MRDGCRTYRVLYHHRIRAEDGQASHVRELIGALREEGHEVEECALVPKADEFALDGRRSSAGRESPGRAASFWSRVSLPRLATEAMEVAYNRTGVRRLREAVRRSRPDFLYERHALHLYAGLTVAREAGIPLLLEVNSPMVEEMTRLRLLRFPKRAARVERSVLGGADWVFPVTEVLRERLVRAGARPDTCRVIGNGAVPERYDADARAKAAALRRELGLAADRFVVGFVGFARDWHRLDLAVGAMAAPGLERMHFVVVGDGPALPDMLSLARDRGVASRVHCLGAVAPTDVPAHVCAFDAGIIPAINPYSSPLKRFDYAAAAVPCLAVDQPNVREGIEDGVTGALFPPEDGDAFTRCLRAWAADRDAARRIGESAHRALVGRGWTWRANARRVIEAFEELKVGTE